MNLFRKNVHEKERKNFFRKNKWKRNESFIYFYVFYRIDLK